ncbi:MAG: prepilin-type N-terminal cleavage/methylation domain-containing protein [Clostridia bacterium]|nr:prepilin-type N-terminal cleavage/methylation domain-containing protein [Clostridia bacterium]
MRISNYFRQKKSKKGLTLVEVICAIFVLAIVFVGVLNAVAFSRQMVFTNNAREKASFKGQLVADEIFSAATGYDPDSTTTNPEDEIEKIVNNLTSDPQNKDSDTAIGRAQKVTTLTDPAAFTPAATDPYYIEYTLDKIGTSKVVDKEDSDTTGKYTEAVEKGWDITVRVFYKEITDDSDFRCIDISAFAPFNYIDDAT